MTDWNLVCRVCLKDCLQLASLFEQDAEGVTHAQKLMDCTPMKIDQNINLPLQICQSCLNDLNDTCRFRVKCENSEAVLQSILNSETIVIVQSKEKSPIEKSPLSINLPWSIKVTRITPKVKEISNEETYLEMDDDNNKPLEIVSTDSVEPNQCDELVVNEESLQTIYVSPSDMIDPIAEVKMNKKRSEKQYECDICGNVYRFNHALQIHRRRHLNEKPFVCKICEKGFVIKFELNRHMRTHTGDKPYGCSFCEKKFSDYGSKIKHERIHTGERPYQCAECGNSFAYKHVLNNHLLVHANVKNYVCDVCGKRFTKLHRKKSHMQVHEREQKKNVALMNTMLVEPLPILSFKDDLNLNDETMDEPEQFNYEDVLNPIDDSTN